MSRPHQIFLALLRIAVGLSILGPASTKLGWFANPTLQQVLAAWQGHAANALHTRYLELVMPHHSWLARAIVVGELLTGTMLVLGLFTPLVAVIALVMVLNFHLGSGAIFKLEYLTGQSGLVYLLVFPILLAGRAGQALGLDGVLGRRMSGGGGGGGGGGPA